MFKCKSMAVALGLLSTLSCVYVSRVCAQASAPVLALRCDTEVVPCEAMRADLQQELGASVVQSAASSLPLIRIATMPNGNIEVSLSSPSTPRVSREVLLHSARPEERAETLSLIAANMVRNEAAGLVTDLEPATLLHQPSPPPSPAQRPRVDPCAPRPSKVFGIDFAPGVGLSSTRAGRRAARALSFGFAGTLSSRLQGVELSIGLNIETQSMCGVQLALANLVHGPANGLQLALFNLTSEDLWGAQLGLANVAWGGLRGLQVGMANVSGGEVVGIEASIFNLSLGDLRGAQIGTVSFTGGDTLGLQYGAAVMTLGALRGVQAGTAAITGRALQGAQVAVGSYAGGVRGAQLGVGNINIGDLQGMQLGVANVTSGEVRGLQLGIFNYADKSAASVGALSIVRRGRTSIDVMGQADTGILTVGVTHGGKYVHNSFGIGPRIGRDGQRLVVTYALGVRAFSSPLLRVDVDAVGSEFISNHMASRSTDTVGVRVPVTFMLWQGLGLMVAPGYQFMITNDSREKEPSIFGHARVHSGSTRVLGYPNLTFGVRYEFDHSN